MLLLLEQKLLFEPCNLRFKGLDLVNIVSLGGRMLHDIHRLVSFNRRFFKWIWQFLRQVELGAHVSVILFGLAFWLSLFGFLWFLGLASWANWSSVCALVLHFVNVIEVLYLHSILTLHTLIKNYLGVRKNIRSELCSIPIFNIYCRPFSLKTAQCPIDIVRQLFSDRLDWNVLIGRQGSRLVLNRGDLCPLLWLVDWVRPLSWALLSTFIPVR